jgi:hypothetical protein
LSPRKSFQSREELGAVRISAFGFVLAEGLGSAGCQPAVAASLPGNTFAHRILKLDRRLGKLPRLAGGQLALPNQKVRDSGHLVNSAANPR